MSNDLSKTLFNQALLEFMDASPTPFHAVYQMTNLLDRSGFQALDEKAVWQLEPGSAYYTVRNGSSIIAWRQPQIIKAFLRDFG
ncbi:hypothetical protein [Nitrincola sp. A-D6]|uniref:hypothetical protein n=1 Tax=Nitrincola sp. A-D6 TaxID=1545442 RepID=UPI002E0D6819